ncbi:MULTISPECIES: hypothetical protein [unclassified Streptomyces]|uniref:hypothetical protein n=1 Tax=unclassified Streptomyces TaxID=2593676 RepID=UPI00081B76F9|nr:MULTISPECIES: hypothetical protein [unclassified Streptomyces]SCD46992.1 endoglucanase [Streptomyces sp. PalvLS-984]
MTSTASASASGADTGAAGEPSPAFCSGAGSGNGSDSGSGSGSGSAAGERSIVIASAVAPVVAADRDPSGPDACAGTVGVDGLSNAAATRSAAAPSPSARSPFSSSARVVARSWGEAGAGTEAFAVSDAEDAEDTGEAEEAEEAEEDGEGEEAVSASGSVGGVRSACGGTVAVVGSSCSVRPNTLRSKLRMPMGEAFRMSWVR